MPLDIVYSQPADTGTGNNINTQLVYAVNYLKVRNVSVALEKFSF
jgi:transcription initiation factor TFIIE subunit beta